MYSCGSSNNLTWHPLGNFCRQQLYNSRNQAVTRIDILVTTWLQLLPTLVVDARLYM